MHLEIAQCKCGANCNCCIRNCLERQREVVSTDHLESLHKACLPGTSRILCKVIDTGKVTCGDLMFKEDSSKPSRSCVY